MHGWPSEFTVQHQTKKERKRKTGSNAAWSQPPNSQPSLEVQWSRHTVYFVSNVSSVKLFTLRILSGISSQWSPVTHNIKATTSGLWRTNYAFQIVLSIHSCKDVEEEEEMQNILSKQYPIAGIQMGVSVSHPDPDCRTAGSGGSRRWLEYGSVYIKARGP